MPPVRTARVALSDGVASSRELRNVVPAVSAQPATKPGLLRGEGRINFGRRSAGEAG